MEQQMKNTEGNGCGPSWLPSVIKDLLFNWFFEASCNRHDISYKLGGNSKDRKHYDKLFLTDMLKDCNNFTGLSKFVRLSQAYTYYFIVRAFGWIIFKGGDR